MASSRCAEATEAGRCVLPAGHAAEHSLVEPPATLSRAYKGNATESAAGFARDAAVLASVGYHPLTQSYTPGSWGAGAFIFALLLCIFLIGILVFIYLIVVKPPGTLVVTYQWQRPIEAPATPGGA